MSWVMGLNLTPSPPERITAVLGGFTWENHPTRIFEGGFVLGLPRPGTEKDELRRWSHHDARPRHLANPDESHNYISFALNQSIVGRNPLFRSYLGRKLSILRAREMSALLCLTSPTFGDV